MNKYTATVIKTGNSYALRVPKAYAVEAGLVVGTKVELDLPTPLTSYDPAAVRRAIVNLQQIGAFADIQDPVAWQREIRKDRPLPGHDY